MSIKIETAPGRPFPLGLSAQGDLINFAVYCSSSKEVYLGIGPNSEATFPMNRSGNIWHIALKNLPPDSLYAYKTDYSDHWLLDPYAKQLDSVEQWNQGPELTIRAFVTPLKPFDWENITRPHIPKQNTVIYEMHVRGFTKAAHIKCEGTYLGVIEKIPYLLDLGITAVELLPIHEFDECHSKTINPHTKERLPNYWGYNPLSYFAPKRSYSASGDPVTELKTLIKELHKNEIEVILDVVYNHTGEGSEKDYIISWRGLDSKTYYLDHDYTGCGNTLNANHPQVQEMILASLRYFAEEFQVDGFRFDLASTFLRGQDGAPLEQSPIAKAICNDPILATLKLISEPWDATGLYHVGHFATLGPWCEWNGKYRDDVRKFLKGTEDHAHKFGDALCGSEKLYVSPLSSVNFITAHDGFTLRDLVTYQNKNNLENGEDNRDGNNQNDNWNCGAEGITTDPVILELRERQMRNHLLALFVSQGLPMLLMGDEYGHTRLGNNNPYVQDNKLNWQLWDEIKIHKNIFLFVKSLIAFRKATPLFHRTTRFTELEISWHGQKPNHPNWSTRFVALSTNTGPNLYIAFNAEHQHVDIELPTGKPWHLVVNTNDGWDKHHFTSKGPKVSNHQKLSPHSAIICIREGK